MTARTPRSGDANSYRDRKWMEGVGRLADNPLNGEGFIVSVTIPAGTEVSIPNEMNVVPRYYTVLSDEGNGIIKRGATTWTTSNVYLRNVSGSSDAIATVRFIA